MQFRGYQVSKPKQRLFRQLHHKIAFCVLLASLVAASNSQAQDNNSVLLPKETPWVLQVDFDALKQSPGLSGIVSNLLNSQIGKQQIPESLKFLKQSTWKSATIFPAPSERTVVAVRVKTDVQKVVNALKREPSYVNVQFRGKQVHHWTFKVSDHNKPLQLLFGNAGKKTQSKGRSDQAIYLCTFDHETFVLGSSLADMAAAINAMTDQDRALQLNDKSNTSQSPVVSFQRLSKPEADSIKEATCLQFEVGGREKISVSTTWMYPSQDDAKSMVQQVQPKNIAILTQHFVKTYQEQNKPDKPVDDMKNVKNGRIQFGFSISGIGKDLKSGELEMFIAERLKVKRQAATVKFDMVSYAKARVRYVRNAGKLDCVIMLNLMKDKPKRWAELDEKQPTKRR